MSIEAMSACWGDAFPVKAPKLSPAAVRVVALAVADVVNDMHGYEFYAARKNVAKKVGMDPDTVGDVLAHLVESGVLAIVKADKGRPTRYRWLIGDLRQITAPLRQSAAPRAVTSPHHKTKRTRSETRNADVGARRDYNDTPLTPEQIAEKFGIVIDPYAEEAS